MGGGRGGAGRVRAVPHRVRRVPVMKNGRLVGVIARRDVLRALHEAQEAVCAV